MGGMELTGDATGTGSLAGPSSSAAAVVVAPAGARGASPVLDAPVLAAGTGSTLAARTVLSALASGGGGGGPQLAAAATSTAAADGGASQLGTGTPSQLAAGASQSGSVAW